VVRDLSPEDEAKIRKILDEALRGGPKPHRIVRVTGTLKTPGSVQYQMRHLSFTIEEELPGDKKRSDVVREICEDVGPLVLELEHETVKPDRAKPNPPPGAGSEPTPELDPTYLDGLPWTPFDRGGGAWIFANTEGAEGLADEIRKANGPITIGSYRYRITRGRDGKREFVNRFPVTGK